MTTIEVTKFLGAFEAYEVIQLSFSSSGSLTRTMSPTMARISEWPTNIGDISVRLLATW
jgi:hypothetical protein